LWICRVFHSLLPCIKTVCRLSTLLRDSSESPGAQGTPLVKGPERYLQVDVSH
jgi:hypothetical protein